MEFVNKKIVCLGFQNEITDYLSDYDPKEITVLTKSREGDDSLSLKNRLKDFDVEIKYNFFVLTLLENESSIVGLIGIDKVLGDVYCVQFEKLLIDEDSRYFAEQAGEFSQSVIENKSKIDKEDFQKLCEKFLSNFRIIPDLEKIRAARKQLEDFLAKNPSEEEKSNFLEVLRELLDRNKIEIYDDRSNVYAIIEQIELEKEISQSHE